MERDPETSASALLAQANLHRIRGEYEEAKRLCREILAEADENVPAHVLLGDIFCEEGDLDHAREWYDLAAEQDGRAPGLAEKLASVKRRISDREATQIIAQLGLPTSRPRALQWAIGSALFVIAVGVSGYFLGSRLRQPPALPIAKPILLNEVKTTEPAGREVPENPTPIARENPKPPTEIVQPTAQEADLTSLLRARCVEGDRVVLASQDMRSESITLWLTLRTADNAQEVAAKVGHNALDIMPSAPKVTIRTILDGRLVFEGDLNRTDLVAALEAHTDGTKPTPSELLRDTWMLNESKSEKP